LRTSILFVLYILSEVLEDQTRRMRLRLTTSARAAPWLVSVFLLASVPAAHAARDVITLHPGGEVEGVFEAYRNGRFYFQPHEGRKLHELAGRVKSLALDPPALVSVKPRGKKTEHDRTLKGYTEPYFVFLEDDARETRMMASHVTLIEPGLDFKRFLPDTSAADAETPDSDKDIEELVRPGKATIVHFHMASALASVRQGNYVRLVAEKNRNRLVLIKLDLADWDDPVAKKYKISSVPQFWFYDRQGRLVRKLTERFTSDDLDKALAEVLPGVL